MDFLALGKAIADIGGWAAFFGLMALLAAGGIRRWWVFGWMYDRIEARAEKSDTQAERNAESLEAMSRTVERLERDIAALSPRRVNRE